MIAAPLAARAQRGERMAWAEEPRYGTWTKGDFGWGAAGGHDAGSADEAVSGRVGTATAHLHHCKAVTHLKGTPHSRKPHGPNEN